MSEPLLLELSSLYQVKFIMVYYLLISQRIFNLENHTIGQQFDDPPRSCFPREELRVFSLLECNLVKPHLIVQGVLNNVDILIVLFHHLISGEAEEF